MSHAAPGEPEVERKVTVATVASALTVAVLWALSTYVFKGDIPEEVKGVVAIVVTALVTFVTSYATKHTWRKSPIDGNVG